MVNNGRQLTSLFNQTENLIFTEFYDVRQETTPKAGWLPMFTLTGVVYAAAIIAFGLLFANEASKSYIETIIVSYDNTGTDGYTCQMISKVTASYEVLTESEPTLAFSLVNVIESRSQYEQDYATADPCNHPLLFYPGETVDRIDDDGDVQLSAAVLYGSDMVIYTASAADTQELHYYNYTTGINQPYTLPFSALPGSVAVDIDGSAILLGSDSAGAYDVYRVTEDRDLYSLPAEKLYTFPSPTAPIVLNDNLYNIYLVENNTLSALDVYTGGNATNTTLFTLPAGEFIRYAAVYNSGTEIKVYFLNNSDYLVIWEDGTFTAFAHVPDSIGVAVDGNDNFYYADSATGGTITTLYGADRNTVAYIFTSARTKCLTVTTDSARALLIGTNPDETAPDLLYFVYDLLQDRFDNNAEAAYYTRNFAQGYFTCGARLLNSTQIDNTKSEELPNLCHDNGILGQILFQSTYFFSGRDADTYALKNSAKECPNLFAPIGETIADLPPYSCTRTIHRSFLECLSSAFANTQLLLQILVFLSAMLLTKLSTRFPVQRHVTHTEDKSVELTSAASGKEGSTVDNPMAQEQSQTQAQAQSQAQSQAQ